MSAAVAFALAYLMSYLYPLGECGDLARAHARARARPGAASASSRAATSSRSASRRSRPGCCSTATGRAASSPCCSPSRRWAPSRSPRAGSMAGARVRARRDRHGRRRVPDGAAEGDRRVAARAAPRDARRMDDGGRRARRASARRRRSSGRCASSRGARCSSAFGIATLVIALLLAWRVPDLPRTGQAVGRARAVRRRARACSRAAASGGSRRSAASAWARSWPCRDCGRCRG